MMQYDPAMQRDDAATAAPDWTFDAGRVHARPVDDRDRALYHALYADPRVMTHIGASMDAVGIDTLFDRVLRHNANPAARARYWQLAHARTGEPVGIASLVREADAPHAAELGLMLLSSSHGQGIGLQVMAALVEWTMEDRGGMGIDLVIGRYADANLDVRRVGRRIGFQRRIEFEDGSVEAHIHRADWLAERAREAAASGSDTASGTTSDTTNPAA